MSIVDEFNEMNALFVQRAKEYVEREGLALDYSLDNAIKNLCESQIERRLLLELAFVFGTPFDHMGGADIHDCTLPFPMDDRHVFTLAPQFPVGKYRVDIALIVRGMRGKVLRIAVECDGHDFHERTKQQAERDKKRDREMQKAGWMVFRFTGSEIYNHGRERAYEVGKYAVEWFQGTQQG